MSLQSIINFEKIYNIDDVYDMQLQQPLTCYGIFFNNNATNRKNEVESSIHKNDIECIKYLITLGFDDYRTGLFYSSRYGNLTLVKFFMNGMLHSFNDEHDILTVFYSKYIYNRGLINAAKGGKIEIIQYFINKGSNDFHTGLYYASKHGHIDAIELLINKGGDLEYAISGAKKGNRLDIVQQIQDKDYKMSIKYIIGCVLCKVGINFSN